MYFPREKSDFNFYVQVSKIFLSFLLLYLQAVSMQEQSETLCS